MTALSGKPAARQAKDEAALPVEAVATTLAFCASARLRTTALARSLVEADGLRPSSLTSNRFTPAAWASRGASYRGVQPTCGVASRPGPIRGKAAL